MKCLFSIIIPCYNSYNQMQKCLESLQNQTYQNFEIIIVDDCSTDDSFESIKAYCRMKNINNISILKTENNRGPGNARNVGLDNAKGEYVLFVDSDDYISSQTLNDLNNIIEESKCESIIFDYYLVMNRKEIMCNTIHNAKEGLVDKSFVLKHSSGSVWCKCYMRKIIEENKVQFPNFIRGEDLCFNKMMTAKCNSIYYLKKPYYFYINNQGSIMNSNKTINIEKELSIYDLLVNELGKEFSKELDYIFAEEICYTVLQNMVILKYANKDIKKMIKSLKQKNNGWQTKEMLKDFRFFHKFILKLANLELVFFMVFVLKIKFHLKKMF